MIYDLNYSGLEIASAIQGILIGNDVKIYGLSINSKEKLNVPYCFFAIRGKNKNGNDFINEAIKNGARLIVTDEKKAYPVSTIYVKNTTLALGLLAKKHKKSTKIVAVTGSSGKTTTKNMIISVLKEKFSVCGTKENENNEIGVALTLLSIKKEEICVVEMGMRGQGEIEWLSYISEPYVSVITNCGKAHIGILGSEENIFKAKTEILKYTSGYAILPNESRFRKLENQICERIFVGENGDFSVLNLRRDKSKIIFDINECKNITINGIYEHSAINALNAFAVGRIFKIEDVAIKNAISKHYDCNGRGEIITIKCAEVINDCYNASFESMVNAIENSSKYAKGEKKRLIVILGDMLELGENSGLYHKKIGKLCKELSVDRMYALGEYAKDYIVGYENGYESENIDELKDILNDCLNEANVILVKASHSMNFEKIIGDLRETNK